MDAVCFAIGVDLGASPRAHALGPRRVSLSTIASPRPPGPRPLRTRLGNEGRAARNAREGGTCVSLGRDGAARRVQRQDQATPYSPCMTSPSRRLFHSSSLMIRACAPSPNRDAGLASRALPCPFARALSHTLLSVRFMPCVCCLLRQLPAAAVPSSALCLSVYVRECERAGVGNNQQFTLASVWWAGPRVWHSRRTAQSWESAPRSVWTVLRIRITKGEYEILILEKNCYEGFKKPKKKSSPSTTHAKPAGAIGETLPGRAVCIPSDALWNGR